MKIRAMCTKGDEGGLCDLIGRFTVVPELRYETERTGFWEFDTSEMYCPEHFGLLYDTWKIILIGE